MTVRFTHTEPSETMVLRTIAAALSQGQALSESVAQAGADELPRWESYLEETGLEPIGVYEVVASIEELQSELKMDPDWTPKWLPTDRREDLLAGTLSQDEHDELCCSLVTPWATQTT